MAFGTGSVWLLVVCLLSEALAAPVVDLAAAPVLLQEQITPAGMCEDANLPDSDWAKCAAGTDAKGKLSAKVNGIFSLEGCKAAIIVNCYPQTGLYASYNAVEDVCGWQTSCDMSELKRTDSKWRTERAELASDAMALVVNAKDQLMGSRLDLMVCGTTCVCTGLDSCQGQCEYTCAPTQTVSPPISVKGTGASSIIRSKDIQNPLKVCLKLQRGGGPWVWQNVRFVKGLNKFEVGAAPGQNVLSATFRGADSCRTLPEPCFINNGACPSPSVPAGYDTGIKAKYLQMDTSCHLPSNRVFDSTTPSFARLEDALQPLNKLPFVTLAPSASAVSFAAQWEGKISIKEAGEYEFFAEATGVVGLWVKGVQVISPSGCLTGSEKSGKINLNAGSFPNLLVRFTHKGAGAALKLSYKGADTDGKKVQIPEKALWHRSTGTGADAENVAVTIVGMGDVPHVQLCGTRAKDGGCAFDASCERACTSSVKLSSRTYMSKSAVTVLVPRGSATDHVQMVMDVCFSFPHHKPHAAFSWESVTVDGQYGTDGTAFTIKPTAHGEPMKVARVGNGPKRCMSGAPSDTSRFPYQVANNNVPDESS